MTIWHTFDTRDFFGSSANIKRPNGNHLALLEEVVTEERIRQLEDEQ